MYNVPAAKVAPKAKPKPRALDSDDEPIKPKPKAKPAVAKKKPVLESESEAEPEEEEESDFDVREMKPISKKATNGKSTKKKVDSDFDDDDSYVPRSSSFHAWLSRKLDGE